LDREEKNKMNRNQNKIAGVILWITFLLIVSLWLADTLFEYLWFNIDNQSFLTIFSSLNDPHGLLVRLIFTSVVLIGGFTVSRLLSKLAISESKAIEQRENLRTTLNAIGDAVISTDTKGKITSMNPVAGKLTGWTIEKTRGKPLTEVFHIINSQTMEPAVNPVEQVLKSGEILRLANHTKLIAKDGVEYQIADSAAPIHDGAGAIIGVVLVFRDVTEEYLMRENLRQSEKRMELALHGADLGTWDWKVLTGEVTFNERWAEMLGFSLDEVEPHVSTWENLVHPDDMPCVMDVLKAHLDGRTEYYETEHRVKHKSGGWVWVLDKGRVTEREADGKPIRACGTHLDITSRKRATEEKLVLERQVLHAQKLESLGVLAGGIAHDFNNILMTILGNTDLAIYKLSPTSPAIDNIEEIEKATRRASELAKQMLAYSGKGRFVIEPIDSNKLIEEMAHLLEVSISKNVKIEYKFAETPPTFDGDMTQIRQVIMNLITNASEAIGDKYGVITLSTGMMNCDRVYLDEAQTDMRTGLDEPLQEGVYTYMEVADTGCGMDAMTIEKIFDPFYSTKFAGRGLGMSAALGIARGHKGAIKIDSEVGKGTTFKVLFPTNNLRESGIVVPGQEMAERKDWRGKGAILIADDEQSVCGVAKQMLEHMGFSVLTANDGNEALQLFCKLKETIACVLLDLMMPNMNGEDAFREMKLIQPGVKVILCSGYNEQDATQRFTGKGLAGFIQKPFNMAALKEKLREILSDEVAAPSGRGDHEKC